LEARQAQAVNYVDRLSEEIGEYEIALLKKAKEFSASQLAEIRTGNVVTDATREKINALLYEITGHFILTYQEPNRTKSLNVATAKNMFAFRYALCVVLFYLEWVQLGRGSKNLTRCMTTRGEIEIARRDLADWMERFDNYSGNNPNKYQSDIKAARRRVRQLEDDLKA